MRALQTHEPLLPLCKMRLRESELSCLSFNSTHFVVRYDLDCKHKHASGQKGSAGVGWARLGCELGSGIGGDGGGASSVAKSNDSEGNMPESVSVPSVSHA